MGHSIVRRLFQAGSETQGAKTCPVVSEMIGACLSRANDGNEVFAATRGLSGRVGAVLPHPAITILDEVWNIDRGRKQGALTCGE